MTGSNIGNNLEEIRELLNLEQPPQALGTDYAWFVGATGNNAEGVYTDFSDTYISEGRWMNGYESKYIDEVKSVKVGDKIALKSAYTKKKGLPFNNNGKTVGVMAIKAIGTVTENPGDGRNLKVNWTKVEPIREWYGKGILRLAIHLVKAQDGLMKKLLLQFTFGNAEQDYSLCEEQYADDLDDDNAAEEIIIEKEDKEYTLEELAQILTDMYNFPEVSKKVTAVHMFGLKYGEQIRKNGFTSAAIIAASALNESYHAELTKGINMYESIKNNEFGVAFYDGIEPVENNKKDKNQLPTRAPRSNAIHPLNQIIYGAPGTGKTYSTAEYALAIIENRPVDLSRKTAAERKALMEKYNNLISENRIVFTTFHQSYGYEEFIQGLRPDTKAGNMSFKTSDGVFKNIADNALHDENNNYVIIIDEINRANISKVFGELITLIEEDKRWGEINETCATLQSGDVFAVPNNLYIVGTMNSADKSISLIDAALRRRFEFIEQHPDTTLVDDPVLRGVLKKLNELLADSLESSDLLIGHSYFMGKDEASLCTIMNNSIIPLLYEYFYDNKKKVISVLTDCLKDLEVKVKDNKISRVYVERVEASE